MTNPSIVLYVARGCSQCETAKACLEAYGASFTEVVVTDDARSLRELVKAAGEAVVPTLVVGVDVQIGFDRARFEDMVANPLPPDDDPLSVLRAVLDPERAPALVGTGEGRAAAAVEGQEAAPNASGGMPVVSEELDDLDG